MRYTVPKKGRSNGEMSMQGLSGFFQEVRRRRVVGVLALYIVGAWIALQVAATLFPGWRIPEEAIRYVWIGTVLLFPVAVIFAWYYDVSASGVRRTAPRGSDVADLPLGRNDALRLTVLAVMGLLICGGVVREILLLRSPPPETTLQVRVPENSIAVLPFVNMSDDDASEYFSDGISEQLLNELARIPGLHVAARTSSFYFKGKAEPVQSIGQQLGVRTLLEGSVRRSGDTVRITAQLINASDGYHLWSQDYDREFDDVLLVQDEIARSIAKTLRVELMRQGQPLVKRLPTDNPEAYDLFLQAADLRQTYTLEALLESNVRLQRAIELAPDFALAYSALAFGHVVETWYGNRTIDDAAIVASDLLETALRLEPELEEAHAALGMLKSRLGHYDESNAHYERALELNPNLFPAHVNYGLSLVYQSRLNEASRSYLRAQALDPLNANLSANLGALLMLMGEFDSGSQFMQKAVKINPDNLSPMASLAHWMGEYGQLVEAMTLGAQTLQQEPALLMNQTAVVQAYRLLGRLDEAQAFLEAARVASDSNAYLDHAERELWETSGDMASLEAQAVREVEALDLNIGDPLSNDQRAKLERYGLALLLSREHAEAIDILEWVAGDAAQIEETGYNDMRRLKLLALVLKREGRDTEADALLDRCLELVRVANENGWATPALFVRLAEIHAIRGDMAEAANVLEDAFDKGWRDIGNIEHGVFWQDAQDDPRLAEIKVMIIEDVNAQLERLPRHLLEVDAMAALVRDAA